MADDDELDGQRGYACNGGEHRLTVAIGNPGIDDYDATITDDESRIADDTSILRRNFPSRQSMRKRQAQRQ